MHDTWLSIKTTKYDDETIGGWFSQFASGEGYPCGQTPHQVGAVCQGEGNQEEEVGAEDLG